MNKKFGLILPIILISYFMILLDNSIVFTSTVKIAADLQLNDSTLAWVTNAYALTFGGLLLLGGRSGDVFGRRHVFLIGLIIFSVGSLFVGLATSGTVMISMRAIQGIGSAITTVKPGDFVIAPFTHGCGECAACLAGFDGTCDRHPGYTNWSNGFQSEYIRFTYANWALIKIPGHPEDYTDGMLKSLLTLADVMPTGYHAARSANVQKGDKVVVIGDGAVGQCAVIAAKMRGASQIILMSRHADRQQMALQSGATAVVAERGAEGIAKVREILGGDGADAALECVGTEAAIEQALGVLHNGGRVGFVGVPHYNTYPIGSTFAQNITIAGGSASVTTYDKKFLLKSVLDGDINPGRVFTNTYDLVDINQAYQDMQNRKTIKAMIKVAD